MVKEDLQAVALDNHCSLLIYQEVDSEACTWRVHT